MFIDIHNHMLFEIDDGAKNKEMSLDMLMIAENEGIKEIILTPHYISHYNTYKIEDLRKTYKELKELAIDKHIDVKLHLGNEIHIDKDILQAVKGGNCLTLAESKYLLIEFPNLWNQHMVEPILFELMLNGYKIILAHVERYDMFIKNIEILEDYIQKGCLAQMNASSLIVKDRKLRKHAQKLLKKNYIHIISTDAHSNGRRSPIMKEAYNVSLRLIGEKSKELFYLNPKKIISNEDILIDEIITKRKLFSRRKRSTHGTGI